MSSHLYTSLRRHCGVSRSRCPVAIVPGDLPPTLLGEAGHSEFKTGGIAKFPGSACRAGYRVRYVRSTQRIEVGDVWLAAAWSILAPLYDRLDLPLDRTIPVEVLADWLEEHQHPEAPCLRAALSPGRAVL